MLLSSRSKRNFEEKKRKGINWKENHESLPGAEGTPKTALGLLTNTLKLPIMTSDNYDASQVVTMLNVPLSFQIPIQLKGDEGELYTPNQLYNIMSISHITYC